MSNLLSPLRHETDLDRISGKLRDVVNARFDVVAPQSSMRIGKTDFTSINLWLGEPQLTSQGVTEDTITAGWTRTAYRQIAERLRIPLQYLDRLHLMEHPVGQMLAAQSVNDLASIDGRRAMYRFVNLGDEGYVLRAMLSDRYRVFDADHALIAVMGGLTANELNLMDCEVDADVTVDRLRLRIAIPQVAAAVPDLLGDYRMPFSMDNTRAVHAPAADGETPPWLWAGIEVSNSDTGGGALSIAPRIVIPICRNGLTRSVALRKTHLGAAMDDGVVDWSDETRQTNLTLITSMVTDAVATFCSQDYLDSQVTEMRVAKGVEVGSSSDAVEIVQNRLGLTEVETASVFDCFARGGDMTVFGLAQSVTAAAQLSLDGDRQSEMENLHWEIMEQPAEFAAA